MNAHPLFRRQLLVVSMLLPMLSLAQEKTPASVSYFSNALFNTLLATIILLLILIAALGTVLKNLAASDLLRQPKKEKDTAPPPVKGLLLLGFMGLSLYAAAQGKSMVSQNDWRIGDLDPFTFYLMMTVIGLELLVVGVLVHIIKTILASVTPAKTKAVERPKAKPLIDKLNAAVDVAEEEAILLDHDYDGIRELDNDLPPWWKYGFYLTVLVSVVYMIHYHVSKTAPLQAEEYTQSMKKAEAEIAEFMKNSANNVDETTVKLLTDPTELASGKDLFIANCAACHGKLGEGTVGPNLTDDYWLHAGSVKDIFKTIKYGWPDKGMKAWKEDFSPVQIAQLTSFIKTLRGTNPPKAKEQQGDLYVEASNLPADSTGAAIDSLKTVIIPDSTKK
jgi:cytochrome c oxidase cbb3-type subunit III